MDDERRDVDLEEVAAELTLRRLTRTAFLGAVAGYSPSADAADGVIAEHLGRVGAMLAR